MPFLKNLSKQISKGIDNVGYSMELSLLKKEREELREKNNKYKEENKEYNLQKDRQNFFNSLHQKNKNIIKNINKKNEKVILEDSKLLIDNYATINAILEKELEKIKIDDGMTDEKLNEELNKNNTRIQQINIKFEEIRSKKHKA